MGGLSSPHVIGVNNPNIENFIRKLGEVFRFLLLLSLLYAGMHIVLVWFRRAGRGLALLAVFLTPLELRDCLLHYFTKIRLG